MKSEIENTEVEVMWWWNSSRRLKTQGGWMVDVGLKSQIDNAGDKGIAGGGLEEGGASR